MGEAGRPGTEAGSVCWSGARVWAVWSRVCGVTGVAGGNSARVCVSHVQSFSFMFNYVSLNAHLRVIEFIFYCFFYVFYRQ